MPKISDSSSPLINRGWTALALRELFISIGFKVDGSPLDSLNTQVDDLTDKVSKSTGIGQDMLNKFTSVGDTMQGIGKKMTTHITMPVAGAVTAVGGLTAALGFKRLVGMDNAQAKLRGLGYEGQAVERIMQDVNEAVTGTTHTMAEGVDAAAGALAAGVKEGAELERYIKLVGDAAIGSNRPMNEMAQIFNRVQGSGKLMTQELNMIEMGMPGFSQAMADHLADGSLEAFRDMVTAGEIGSSEFLDVMEDFAGGMSEAYADTWSGMTKNVLANVGILGESLVGGLFEDGKEGLVEFLDVLRSDELRDWATETGENLREFANTVVEKATEMKTKWDELSPPIQDIIKKVALFGTITATIFGPFLLIFGKVLSVIAPFIGVFSKLIGLVRTLSVVTKVFNLTLLASPITWIVLGIMGLIAAVVLLWKNWDTVSQWLSDSWEWIKEKAVEIFTLIGEWINEKFNDIIEWIVRAWDDAKEWTSEKLDSIWETVKEVWDDILTSIGEFLEDIGSSITEGFMGFVDTVSEWMGNAYDTIVELWGDVVEFFVELPSDMISYGKDIVQGLIDGILSMGGTLKESILNFVSDNIPDPIAEFLGIASPSRLMMEYGVNIGEGLQIGIDDSAMQVARSAQDLAQTASPSSYTPDKESMPQARRGGNYHFTAQTTIHINGNMSPEQEQEVKGRWKRTIKQWHEEFHHETTVRRV